MRQMQAALLSLQQRALLLVMMTVAVDAQLVDPGLLDGGANGVGVNGVGVAGVTGVGVGANDVGVGVSVTGVNGVGVTGVNSVNGIGVNGMNGVFNSSLATPLVPSYASGSPVYGGPPLPYSSSTSVHRSPHETHDAFDAVRTQDADLAPTNPYANPHLAPHVAALVHQDEHGPHGPHLPFSYHPKVAHVDYGVALIPQCAYANQKYYGLDSICVQDDFYPVEEVRQALKSQPELAWRLLSDVTYQSADNLIDGLTRAQEEGFASPAYSLPEALCASNVFYGRPKRAVNTFGEWKVIVNLPESFEAKAEAGYGKVHKKVEQVLHTQTQRLEICKHPNHACNHLDSNLASGCLQKHNFVRMLAFSKSKGLHIDSFKVPIACSCYVQKYPYYGNYAKSYGYNKPSYKPSYKPTYGNVGGSRHNNINVDRFAGA